MRGYLDALEDILQGVGRGTIGRGLRLVVTGSRDGWEPAPAPLIACFDVIAGWYGRDVRLAHGAARGVDTAADRMARTRRWPQPMRYPVSDREWQVYGKVAGHQRNARMLEAELPDLVLALIWNRSRGATGCADNALARGIPVLRIDEELAQLPRVRASL